MKRIGKVGTARRAGGRICPGSNRSAPRRVYTVGVLSLEDCIGLSDLTEEEILAIARHERIPEIAAAELGSYLVHSPEGELCIKSMIKDDIEEASRAGHAERALALKLVLRNFILQHPRCDERWRTELRLPERRRL